MTEMKEYVGGNIFGTGSEEKLRLIDQSIEMLSPTPNLPYMQMVWNSKANTFKEGFIWGTGFWMQNSYGFVYGATPLLNDRWRTTLQNSLDLFWDHMGDGKRIGMDNGIPDPNLACMNFCAPDGSLGDCVFETGIVYRQGDGPFEKYDWFFEATACGILLECEILLFERDKEKIKKYIPLMRRSMEHIESRRAENGLFLVGASSNLLAPSFGGTLDEKGEPDRSYLTGIAVTSLAAEERFAEVAKLAGDSELEKLCAKRAKRTREALPLLLTDEGYFLKSMEKDGTPHGLYGAEKHGYLEASANVDAVAHRAVNKDIRESIMAKLDSVAEIRTAGPICANYPALDDAAFHVLSPVCGDYIHQGGNWVDGGCWATVEGRNIIACLENNRAEVAFRAAGEYMKWALDYRQDAPLSQWGRNTCNVWQQENEDHSVIGRPVSVMIDNFAPVTCLIRGLFSPRAYADRLELMLNLPKDVSYLEQDLPICFGNSKLRIRGKTGKEAPVAYLDGKQSFAADEEGRIAIPAELLCGGEHEIYITAEGTGYTAPKEVPLRAKTEIPNVIPEGILGEILLKTAESSDPEEQTVYQMALSAVLRRNTPFDKEFFRPMTEDKKEAIIKLCDEAAISAYEAIRSKKQ